MPLLFALTMFVSATLLFLVEPMVGKMILPLLGGTPAVWNTCMVFFQALLLFGYFYAHRLTTHRPPRKQITIHMVLLGCAIGALGIGALLAENHSPIPIVKSISPQGDEYPFFGVMALLTVAIGLPFFVLCTSAPLLQKWFGETGHPSSKDPYFLYGASNFGSLLALVAYPAVVEPNLRLIHQAWLFAIGYGVLLVLLLYCANAVKNPVVKVRKGGNVASAVADPPPTMPQKLRWLLLAAVPSSLMLAVTTYISTDMASIPLLWIIPLSLYLISFILVFSNWGRHLFTPFFSLFADIGNAFGGDVEQARDDHIFYVLLAPVLILLIAFLLTSHVPARFSMQLLLHMVTFFVVAMVCHGELARSRPSTRYLTSFYLIMSLGGMIGGMFNALVAPIAFNFISEYPITLVVACFLLPNLFAQSKRTSWTAWLDILVPLLMFSLCRILQTNQNLIRDFLFTHGRTMLIGALAFGIPALTIFFLAIGMDRDPGIRTALAQTLGRPEGDPQVGKSLFYARIALAALLTAAGLGYMTMWLPVQWLKDGINADVTVEKYQSFNPLEMPGFRHFDALRFAPALVAFIAFWIFLQARVPRTLLRQYLILGGVGIGVGLASLFFLGDTLWNRLNPWSEVGDAERIRDMIRQITIFGLPAMLCYLFVDRPIRFGGAVAGLWLASFFTDMKSTYDEDFLKLSGRSGLAREMFQQCDGPPGSLDLFYTRTFFGRFKINAGDGYGQTVQLVHGTTLHGVQNRYGDAHAIKVFANTLVPTLPIGTYASVLAVSDLPEWQFPGREPLTYYHRSGPVGSMFDAFYSHLKENPAANSDVACIGLGTGSLSSYGLNTQMMKLFGREGQSHRLTFFEIDQTVRRLVEPPRFFTYIDKARHQGVTIDFEMGDARITMERVNRKFGMMLIDAFSSDAIPAHLLTKEAIQLYFDKLEEDGLLAVHISNRYMNLEPVVDRIAKELDVEARIMHGREDPWDDKTRRYRTPKSWMTYDVADSDTGTLVSPVGAGRSASSWIVLARKKEFLGPVERATEEWQKMAIAKQYRDASGRGYDLAPDNPNRFLYTDDTGITRRSSLKDQWMTLEGDPKVGLWTDDFYSILGVLTGEWRFWARD